MTNEFHSAFVIRKFVIAPECPPRLGGTTFGSEDPSFCRKTGHSDKTWPQSSHLPLEKLGKGVA
jgi:hypothetical protein